MRRRFSWSENREVILIGILVGLVSSILPWGSAFLWAPGSLEPTASTSMSLFDLFASGDGPVALGAVVFVVGMIGCVLSPFSVLVQAAGIILISFTMSGPLVRAFPSVPSGYTASTSLAIGYFVGWLSLIILGSLLVRMNAPRWRRSATRDVPSSETVDIRNLGGAGIPPRR